MRKYILPLLALGLCLAPVASVLVSSALAARFGCTLSEAGPAPCLIAGRDWGGVLNAGFVMGWLALVTIPAAVLPLIWMLRLGVADFIDWRRRC